MSVHTLRDAVKKKLHETLEAESTALIENHRATVDQMRHAQGRIAGIRLSIEVLDREFREMH